MFISLLLSQGVISSSQSLLFSFLSGNDGAVDNLKESLC